MHNLQYGPLSHGLHGPSPLATPPTQPKLLLAALFGAFGGVFSVTVGINFGAATTPQGWWLLALSYGAVWSMVVPALAYLARRLDEERGRYA